MRNCFLPPIKEIDLSIELLIKAVDALLLGDLISAESFLIQADYPEIAIFYAKIAGKTDIKLHWQSAQPQGMLAKLNRIELRMPSNKTELAIFERDGWRCRFCGSRVISRKARAILIKQFPVASHWVSEEYLRHTALHAQASSLDHIVPHSRGGDNAPENLVTACGPCQFGRNCWTLNEIGFNDPRDRQPILDEWDGLTRLCTSNKLIVM